MKELVVLWILLAMTQLSPPHRTHFEVEAKESFAQADARYREIAEQLVEESMAAEPLFSGNNGRIRTAMFVAIKFFYESGFRRDIDLGTSRARLRNTGLNDFGRSWCMGQINLGLKKVEDPDRPGVWLDTSVDRTVEGWTGPELVADRRKCIRATIAILRKSLAACAHLPFEKRLAAYAAGSCASQEGQRLSAQRVKLYQRRLASRPAVTDTQLLEELASQPIKLVTKLVLSDL